MKKIDLQFYKKVPGISIEDYIYWKDALPKLLKTGVELEFNLKANKGVCLGFNAKCKCEHLDECTPIPCAFRDKLSNKCTVYIKTSKACAGKDCKGICNICEHVEYIDCIGQGCAQYIPLCIRCDKNTVNCHMCNQYIDNADTPSYIRKKVARSLKATNNFGKVGDYGVLQVVKDGSLINGGLEIPTVGRRFNFTVFTNMLNTIIDEAYKVGGYLNDRCSTHVHVLAEYYTKTSNNGGVNRHPDDNRVLDFTGLERNIPDIVLQNIIQIWRKYEPGIFWMSCGLDTADSITRWGKFRCPLADISPLWGLDKVVEMVAEHTGNRRYGALNVVNTKPDGSRFHVEFRTLDGVKSATYITAMCALFNAIIKRAVEISVGGVLKVNTSKEHNELLAYIVNGVHRGYGDDRLSDTSKVFEHIDKYIKYAMDLIEFLSPCLDLSDAQMEVLKLIARKPPALYLINAAIKDPMNNYDLEAIYSAPIREAQCDAHISALTSYINQLVVLGVIHDCKSVEEWKRAAYEGSNLDIPYSEFSRHVNRLIRDNKLVWNKQLRTIRSK